MNKITPEKRNKLFNILSLAVNAENVIATSLIGLLFFLFGGEGNMDAVGAEAFQYFTVDSNILIGFFCLLTIPFNIKALKTGELRIPDWLRNAKVAGTTAVTLTLVVALGFLGPVRGFASVLIGYKFFMHVLSPLLAIASLLVFENKGPYKFGIVTWAFIPTTLYGILYLIMVVIVGEENGGWPDHYMFNSNGLWLLAFILLEAVTFGFGALLWFLRKKINEELTNSKN